ncbi:hypothetical protein DdX_21334 [Ditylenchus destructor]|uniref:Uncharacterized protein n=1 Tax=Ditylenchus destructor TaxID=166010 RepID=A0AAD4MJ94_9BILA|nr:hypothetical protein DdX_21334 [Ditylenchus destructor]
MFFNILTIMTVCVFIDTSESILRRPVIVRGYITKGASNTGLSVPMKIVTEIEFQNLKPSDFDAKLENSLNTTSREPEGFFEFGANDLLDGKYYKIAVLYDGKIYDQPIVTDKMSRLLDADLAFGSTGANYTMDQRIKMFFNILTILTVCALIDTSEAYPVVLQGYITKGASSIPVAVPMKIVTESEFRNLKPSDFDRKIVNSLNTTSRKSDGFFVFGGNYLLDGETYQIAALYNGKIYRFPVATDKLSDADLAYGATGASYLMKLDLHIFKYGFNKKCYRKDIIYPFLTIFTDAICL